jgi:S1-C subfamily serine protease
VQAGHNGVRVAKVVSNGPAAKAGLHSGSMIVAVGGTQTRSPSELASAVAAHKPGDRVSVRDDERRRAGDARQRAADLSATRLSGP